MITIEEALTRPEDQYFDRKNSSINISKLSEAIVGLANANGGSIAIGINDGKFVGINSQGNTKIQDFIQCGFDKCIPSIKTTYYFLDGVKDNGKNDRLLVLNIEPSVNQVHTTTGDEVFLRIGDETKRLTHEQRMKLEYDKGTRIYEDSIIEECELDDLNMDAIEEYKKALNYTGEDINKLLRARGFVKKVNGEYKYTVAAVLMFCEGPASLLPGARVRFIG